MSDSFGEGTRALAAFAAQALGWLPRDFWQATPAELTAAAADPAASAQTLTRNELNRMLEHESDG